MVPIHPLLLYSYGNMPVSAWAQANRALLNGRENFSRMPLCTGELLMAHIGDDLHIDMDGKTHVVAIEDMMSDKTIPIQDLCVEPLGSSIKLSIEVKNHIIANAKFTYPYLYGSYGSSKRIYPQRVSDRMEFTCIHSIENNKVVKGYSFKKEFIDNLTFYKRYMNKMGSGQYISGFEKHLNSTAYDCKDYFPVLCTMDKNGKVVNEIRLPSITFPSVAGIHLPYERDLGIRISHNGITLLPYHLFLDRKSYFTRTIALRNNSQFVESVDPRFYPDHTHSRFWYPKHHDILNIKKYHFNENPIDSLTFKHNRDTFQVSMQTFFNNMGVVYLSKKSQSRNLDSNLQKLYLFDNADKESCKSKAVNDVISDFFSIHI